MEYLENVKNASICTFYTQRNEILIKLNINWLRLQHPLWFEEKIVLFAYKKRNFMNTIISFPIKMEIYFSVWKRKKKKIKKREKSKETIRRDLFFHIIQIYISGIVTPRSLCNFWGVYCQGFAKFSFFEIELIGCDNFSVFPINSWILNRNDVAVIHVRVANALRKIIIMLWKRKQVVFEIVGQKWLKYIS